MRITTAIIILIILTLQLPSLALTDTSSIQILENSFVDNYKILNTTFAERMNVKIFINRWYRTIEGTSQINQVFDATKTITKLAKYKKGYLKMSDILKGKGNCQAFSLLFREMMLKCNIEIEIVADFPNNHMYTNIYIYEKWIKHDIVSWIN